MLAVASPVLAVTINTGGNAVANQGLFTLLPQTVTIDFNSNAFPSSGPVVYSGQPGNIVSGNISGVTAAPPNDTTPYLTIGPARGASVTITSTYTMDYFGFYVGSLDSFNYVDLYMGNNVVAALTGTQIATIGGFSANGNQGMGIYVNIYASNSSEYFNRVVLRSTSNAMESDNHAFRAVERSVTTAVNPVPEPASAFLLAPVLIALIGRKAAR
jgi:hypothetical protein